MSGNTIYDLFQRSIAKGPFAEGSESCIYTIDDPAFDGYLLKVLRRPLTNNGKTLGDVRKADKIYMIKTGFAGTKVGQVVASHGEEDRVFLIISRVPGVPLKDKLEACVKECGGDKQSGVNKFLDELIALPTRAYKTLFSEINRGTQLQYGIDIIGNNILMGDGELHTIDYDIRYSDHNSQHYDPEQVNHLDAVATHISSVISDVLPEQEYSVAIRTKESQLHKKMLHAAQRVGFPKDTDEATKWNKQQRFVSFGNKEIRGMNIGMSEDPRKLLETIHRGERFDTLVSITSALRLPRTK